MDKNIFYITVFLKNSSFGSSFDRLYSYTDVSEYLDDDIKQMYLDFLQGLESYKKGVEIHYKKDCILWGERLDKKDRRKPHEASDFNLDFEDQKSIEDWLQLYILTKTGKEIEQLIEKYLQEGILKYISYSRCPICHGTGKIHHNLKKYYILKCFSCKGSGCHHCDTNKPCHYCHGSGRTHSQMLFIFPDGTQQKVFRKIVLKSPDWLED